MQGSLENGQYVATNILTKNKAKDARSFNNSIVEKLSVTADAFNMRLGASKDKTVLRVLNKEAA